MRRALLALGTALTLAAAAPAGAATVSQTTGPYHDPSAGSAEESCSRYQQCGTRRTLTITGDATSPEFLTITLFDPKARLGELVVRSAGPVALVAGAGCAATAPGEVRCAAVAQTEQGSTGTLARLGLGAADDQVTVGPGIAGNAVLGAGDDQLRVDRSSTEDWDASGLSGDDIFRLGRGADFVDGGTGDDAVATAQGDDVLVGGSGSDTLDGAGGNDRLSGGGAADKLLGGTGNDVLRARDGVRDSISCGSGRDRGTADRRDRQTRTCAGELSVRR